MRHVSATGSEIRPIYSTPPSYFTRALRRSIATVRGSPDSVNLAAFVRGGSDHEMKPKTCILRHFRMSKMPTFSFRTWTSEVTS